MTPVEFVIWLRGFAQAANSFTLTPKQWDDVKEKLDRVSIDNAHGRTFEYGMSPNSTTTAKTLLTENTTP